jgi:glutaredoxin
MFDPTARVWFKTTMFRVIRAILGPLLLLFERLFRPKGILRSPQDQRRIDEITSNLALYQFQTCPFCLKVRRVIQKLSLNIETRDILKNKAYEEELIKQGGQRQAPCLRINNTDGSVRWMYESDDIINYLQGLFGPFPTKA